MSAVTAAFSLEELSAWELLEALGTDEAVFMVEISVGVDDPGVVVQLVFTVETVAGHDVVLKCLQRLHLLPQVRVVRGGEGLSGSVARWEVGSFYSKGNIQNINNSHFSFFFIA